MSGIHLCGSGSEGSTGSTGSSGSGGYIDPCESGAYQGSGSIGSAGSWNGSGSGNDSITHDNCCKQAEYGGKCCCGPLRLKMRLYQITHHEYNDPDPRGYPGAWYRETMSRWGTVEDSRVYTLKKTIYCSDTDAKGVRWVIEDPDCTFGDWGDLTGAFVECVSFFDTYYNKVMSQYHLLLPNSPVVSILQLEQSCICSSESEVKGENFVLRSLYTFRYNLGSSYWGNPAYEDPAYGFIPRHTCLIWGENVDTEKCHYLNKTPPAFLQTTAQESSTPGSWTNLTGEFSGAAYWKRFAYTSAIDDSNPPYNTYADCRYPFIGPFSATDPLGLLEHRNMKRAWYLRLVFSLTKARCQIGDPMVWNLDGRYDNLWWDMWMPNGQYYTPSAQSPPRFAGTGCLPTYCSTLPLSISPVYDIVYYTFGTRYFPYGYAFPSGLRNPTCEKWQKPDWVGKRYIITEASQCLTPSLPPPPVTPVPVPPPTPPTSGVVPGFPTPQPPPESGSTPSQSGSAPFSGPGSQPPCGGDCSYNLAWAWFTGKGQQWTLMYKYSSSTCTEWCSCDTNVVGEIYVTYNGPEGGWPAVLHLPCVPSSVQGSTPGSTSEE